MNLAKRILAATFFSIAASHAQTLPAFPGAEGFGSIATGGRGGDVYYVTNLNSSGVGSFAFGVQNAPTAGRTILFAVSGHIRLPSGSGGGLTISRNKITVAGQTAPGDGICFWNNTMNLTGNDLVFRNVRWRYGKQASGGDSVDISGSQRIIFDHCDVMFSTDENMSSFGTAPEHMTFQWSTNAWGLSGHSAGGLWKVKHATVHHTLWANNHTRNPKLIGGDVFDWVNNLTFGWNNGFNMAPDATGGVGINHRVNIRNSTFVHGGSTSSAIYGGALNDDGSTKFKLHMADSALDGNNNGILDVSRTNYQLVNATGYSQTTTAWPQTTLGDPASPTIGVPVTVAPRLTAYKQVMSKTGAVRMEIGSRPLRDEVSQLCVTRAANLQRGIIADPLELNLSTGTGFADLKSSPAPLDTDLDGLPDEWEDALGYNKNTPNNNTVFTAPQTATSFFPSGSPAGYTQLEEYLHFKSIPHGIVARNTAASPSFIDIDLRKYTSGFTSLPVFTLSNITGGTLTQSGPGNALVRFTPTQNTSGRAGFLFTVTDSVGATWTQQCALLISTQTQPRPITWTGDGASNFWNTTAPNFTSTLGPTTFATNDAVTINDSGSNTPNLQLQGALQPASLTVSNTTKNFTLASTGSLTSTGPFSKSGSGSLTISNTGPNSFSSASVEGGTLILSTANALGTAPITFSDGTLSLSADQANALIVDGTVAINLSGSRTMNGAWSGSGTINLTNTGSSLLTLGGGMSTFSGVVNFGTSTGSARFSGNAGSASAAFDLGSGSFSLFSRNGGSLQLGSLTGGPNTSLSGTSSTTVVSTYNIGALDSSTTFQGRITNGGQAATAITKIGSGTLTLTHASSTFTGPTLVNVGALSLLGSLTASPVSIAADATLSGTGTIGSSLTTVAGAIISPGAANGTAAGTLTAASLNLVSPTLRFDLSNNPTAGNDRLHVTGPATLSGNLAFAFNLTHGNLSPGTYELITVPTGPLTTTGLTLSSNLPIGSRQTLTLETHATGIRLVVSGTTANLIWTGANGGLWDQQTTTAWSGASPATFFNSDTTTFNDTATNGSVTITRPVAPQSIIVNNTAARAYTFTGAPITGTTSLVKSGPGTLTLSLPRFDLSNCSITTSSPTITVSSTTGLLPGMTAISRDTPTALLPGTTILAINSATSVTLSQNPTATSTTARIIFETRHTYSGGTTLNAGTLTLASNSWEYYSSAFPPPSNPFGLGTGPITLNGGTLTLLGHSVSTLHVSGALPNDIIVPAGSTATLRSVMRGTYLGDIAGLRGSLTGSGTLNLVVNFAYSAITGDWSEFSGTLNVARPTSGANDPRFQLANPLGLPLATVNLEQVTLAYTATPPPEGVVVPIGSLSGISTAIIAGAQTGAEPVIWRVGSLNTSTTYAGNFTPYGNAGIGLEKTGTGILTLTGNGSLNNGITVEQGTLSYGDAAADLLTSSGGLVVDPNATLQLNQGATLTAATCEVFTAATLRGRGTLQAPLTSDGTLSIIGGTFNVIGDTTLSGTLEFSALTDRLAITGNLDLGGTLRFPNSGLSIGRKLLITHTGTLNSANFALTNIPPAYLARIDTATPGEIAVRLIDTAAYQAWQITNFGNTTNPAGQPTADPDADGLTNFEEFENGSNPNGSLPVTLTISSNDPLSNFSSLNSVYPAGTLTWTNSGTLTTRAVNRLILDTTLTGGTIALGAPTNILTLTTGEIQFLGNNPLTLNGGQLGAAASAVTLSTTGFSTLTLASPVSSGAGSLAITGTANVILNSPNTFTGGLTLNGGTYTQGVINALGPNNATVTLQSGILDLNGLPTSLGTLTGNGGTLTNSSPTLAILTLGSGSGTFAGTLTGNLGLTKATSAYTTTATLSGANSYTGPTTLATTSGSLVLAHNNALGNTPSVDVVGGGTALVLANGITITGRSITLRGSGANNGSLGSFTGPLTTAANATATWTGPITLGDPNGRLGAGNSGTLHLTGPILGSGTNQSLSLSSGSGSTIGTLVLSGANSFTGNISLVRGTLRLGASNTLPATAILDIGSASVVEATTFDLAGFSQSLAGIRRTSTNVSQVSTLTNSSSTPATLSLNQSSNTTYSGLITGPLTLVKSGTGILTLSNSNALSPNTTLQIDGGSISVSASHTITALRINGTWQPPGTYSATNSSSRISGTGSLIVTTSGPSSFASWIDSFTSLAPADRLPSADPDNDGDTNLAEFAFGGNPTSSTDNGLRLLRTIDVDNDSLPDLTLTLELRAGASFSPDGPDLVSAPIDGITYRIQGTSDLTTFDRPISEISPHLATGTPKPGYTFRTFRLNSANGLTSRGFIRASAR